METSSNIENLLARLKTDPYSPRLHLELARAYLDEGEDSKARDVVVKRRNLPSEDPEVHRGWADVCQQLGMARQAKESYEHALRLAPGDSETIYRLALLLAEVGHYERSLRYLRSALKHDPHHRKARELLAENYRALGLAGQAETLSPRSEVSSESVPPRYFPPSISSRDTQRFLRLLAGREVGYAVQQVDAATGQLSYHYQEAPLTHELVASHIMGKVTIAGYPLRLDNTVHYAAVSVEIPRKVLEANLKNQGYLIHLEQMARAHILLLARHARKLALPAYPEHSGTHAHRLWFFLYEPTHFLKVRRFMLAFLEGAPRPVGKLVVEPVLATKPVGIGWLEQPVLFPLGVHRSTLKRSLFLDEEGSPHEEQLKFLQKVRQLSEKAIRHSFHMLRADSAALLSESQKISGTVTKLKKRCPVIREIVQRALAGRMLRREEKVILFYTIGLAERDGDSLHRLLEPCPDYNYEKVQRQSRRLQSNPVSCLKIRELVPELTASVACNCTFDLRGGKYPSPLLHLSPHLVPTAEELTLSASLPIREAARRYVNLRRQSEEISRAIERLEVLLEKYCTRKGLDRIKVGQVRLQRVEEQGQVRWQLEQD